MNFDVVQIEAKTVKTDVLLIFVFANQKKLDDNCLDLDCQLNNEISNMLKNGEIDTDFGSMTIVHTLGYIEPRRVAVLGCGELAKLDSKHFRNLLAQNFRKLSNIKTIETISILSSPKVFEIFDDFAFGQLTSESALLGLYKFGKYKSVDNSKLHAVTKFILIGFRNKDLIEQGINSGLIIAESVNFARDMVNDPPNHMTPTKMALLSKELESFSDNLSVEILDRKEMLDLGMGALLGVSMGSSEPPKFIVMRYFSDQRKDSETIGILGKGITFDSGGLDIKSASGMRSMKGDMAGGAAVIATIKAIARLGLNANVIGIVPATENMPGGSAQRPGDVVNTMDGKTIEIGNTDAEGRLVLADAMAYAVSLKISKIVDVATLTGAISVALGDQFIGAFGNNQEWTDKVICAGNEVGEDMWQLPMADAYAEQYKSNVADINNIGTGGAGSIIGAMIIGEFAKDSSWVHLDIAGTSKVTKNSGIQINGATGVAVRTFVQLIKNSFDNKK